MSTVWEYTDGCVNKYRYALDIYLMAVLSYSYGIIIYSQNNALVHGYNVIYRINDTNKRYLN